MRGLLFIALIPSLITSETLCPNGKTTCPEKLFCCEINGEYSCCDETKTKVYSGKETIDPEPQTSTFLNSSMSADVQLEYGSCDIMSCRGRCCSSSMCCPHQYGSCCSGERCCGDFSDCCGSGCCKTLSTCCGGRCCPFQHKCCGGSWCCHVLEDCGDKYMTCSNKGFTFSPAISTVLVLAFGVLMSRHL